MDKAVKAIILQKGKFLLLRQKVDEKIFYTLPGGRVRSKNYKEELKREVLEETGLIIAIIKYVGSWYFVRESNGVKTVCRTYICRTIEKSKKSPENYEIIKHEKWVSKKEFLSGNYTNNKSLLQLIIKKSV